MSVPPQTIQVKRKRTDDGPVTYLQIQQSKRHRSDSEAYIYQRADPNASLPAPRTPPPTLIKPVIHVSQPGEENSPLDAVKQAAKARKNGQLKRQEQQKGEKTAPPEQALLRPPAVSAPAREPRRFHLSRSPTPTVSHSVLGAGYGHPGGVGKRSRHASPALFIERGRRLKKAAARTFEKRIAALAFPDVAPTEQMDVVAEMEKPEKERDGEVQGEGKLELAWRPKRPVRRVPLPTAGAKTEEKNAAGAKPQLPASLVNRWDADTEQLAREMDQYALEIIGHNLARMEGESKKPAPSLSTVDKAPSATTTPTKLKPKAPAKRFAERHPELAAEMEEKQPAGDTAMDMDEAAAAAAESETDEEDYITETYVRVPGHTMDAAVPPEQVGLLVFDTEPDVEYFYGEESESDSEWEDDEDENAENYYTADYPDDEVASEDEFDRDAYHFRTGNASDLEEFDDSGDEDDDKAVASDDEERDRDADVTGFRATIGRRSPPRYF